MTKAAFGDHSEGANEARLRDNPMDRPQEILIYVLRVIVSLLVIYKIYLIFLININWDEFFYLEKIFRFQRGEPVLLIQSFAVHPFAWLTTVSGSEVEKIHAGRLAIAAMGVASAWLVYCIARRYFTEVSALIAVALYLADPNMVKHAYSFRADPICAFLFLAAFYLFLISAERRLYAVLGGVALAVSLMISVKTVFYGLPFAVFSLGLLFMNGRLELTRIVLFAVSFVVAGVLLLGLHVFALNASAVSESLMSGDETVGILSKIADKVLLETSFFPRWRTFLVVFGANPMLWLAMLGALTLAAVRAGRDGLKEPELLVLSAGSLLLPLLLYRNAFSYFYVFLLPLLFVSIGYLLDALIQAMKGKSLKGILAVSIVICLSILPAWSFARAAFRNAGDNQVAQREIIELVHQLFPEPVPYIDRNSMISSFPKVGFFMSTWGIENYRAQGQPIMRELLRREKPKFLVVNTPVLAIDDPAWFGEDESTYRLFDEDYLVLSDNFVRYWGALYVLGKRFEGLETEAAAFEILVPGAYDVLSQVSVIIDGRTYDNGETLVLEPGEHWISSSEGAENVIIRLAALPSAPGRQPSEMPIYVGL